MQTNLLLSPLEIDIIKNAKRMFTDELFTGQYSKFIAKLFLLQDT
jgi:hypothetical protein